MIEYTEAFGESKTGVMTAKCSVGDGMKSPTGHPATLISTSNRANSINDLARRTARKSQEQNALRSDALFQKELDPGGERCRLSGSRPGDDTEGPVSKRGSLELSFIEISLQRGHTLDLNLGVLHGLFGTAK